MDIVVYVDSFKSKFRKIGLADDQKFVERINICQYHTACLFNLDSPWYYGIYTFLDTLNNAKNLPVEIQECESVNYENLSFLVTYIIPLVCFPMETGREIFVMFSVIIVIGCIFVKTNLYCTNPSLVLLGFNVYKVTCKLAKNTV